MYKQIVEVMKKESIRGTNYSIILFCGKGEKPCVVVANTDITRQYAIQRESNEIEWSNHAVVFYTETRKAIEKECNEIFNANFVNIEKNSEYYGVDLFERIIEHNVREGYLDMKADEMRIKFDRDIIVDNVIENSMWKLNFMDFETMQWLSQNGYKISFEDGCVFADLDDIEDIESMGILLSY